MQQETKLKKRKAAKQNLELEVLEAMRANLDIHDAITLYITMPHLTEPQREKLRAALAALSRAPLTKKLLAFL